ncbi:MAG: asparagine synthase (glutamine-hydrolyzing) [Acidobacteriota bacterium]|nr:asparagine synthase (glutamine-hydrolyzing) [Acidobacteriota bacterium]
MCGISGIVTREPITPERISAVARMDAAQTHRGPDGAGAFSDRHIALAVRRLSIIDPVVGAQPLYNEDHSLALIANGEIYNFTELRQGLQARGHRFATGSDCETILHLYEEHETGCVHHLRGMFAFALWDMKRGRLMLARDRMGEKPLYLYGRDGALMFASELRALGASALVPFELSPEAINLYFHYQYVPEPLTPLKGVRKLDAAHLLTVDVVSWRVAETCYWRMEDAPALTGDPGELIREQLDTVGALTLRADTRVGVALSGGLDSSAVAALTAHRKSPPEIHAFSVGYEGSPESDERAAARALALHLGLPFHEVELKANQMVEFFPELVGLRDDPIADISGYGYYSVMRLAREHDVPVMLQGQGGDELFWGYPLLQQAAFESKQKAALEENLWSAWPSYLRWQRLPKRGRAAVARWVREGGGLLPSWQHLRRHLALPASRIIFYDLAPDFCHAAEGIGKLYAQTFVDDLRATDPTKVWMLAPPSTNIDVRLTRLICDTYLRENGIAQSDRLSMASSVELRLPLVDYKLIETVIGLRKTQPDAHLPSKAWFKIALRDLLPAWVLDRPKRGFEPPTRSWHNALFAAYGNSLPGGYLVQAGVLSQGGACHLATGDFPPDAVAPLSFKVLVLEQWCRQMLKVFAAR